MTMSDPLFEIKNLECAYDNSRKPVLIIDDLTIPKGKITVILGKSGSGKSTLIETLGLMNRTIRSGEIYFHNKHDHIVINKDLWNRQRRMSEIRKKYYSFIFQDDYLIPYYSSFENVVIGPLIQGKALDIQALRAIIDKMNSVKLPPGPLHRRMPNEMAGGQKQRLSFVRAMMKDFSVLFGDEPTGNLDVANSEALLDMVRKTLVGNIDNQGDKRSAIIVSHNIELSIAKADMIVLLSPVNLSNSLHTVEKSDILFTDDHQQWVDGIGNRYSGFDSIVSHIRSQL